MSVFSRGRKKADLINAYKSVFKSPEGQKVLYDLVRKGNIMANSFQEDSNEMTFFREGQRSIVLDILGQINANPNEILDLIDKEEKRYKEEDSYGEDF